MALVQCKKIAPLSALFSRVLSRRLSQKNGPVNESDIKKSVFISQSNDVYTNLALEDWLYRNFDFTNHHVLMMWRNSPSVVIGRHQNPWAEVNHNNLKSIADEGVQLARRSSGGGTVYNDLGNLNMTFFTPKGRYNGKYNSELIRRALFRQYGLKVAVNPKEDLTIREKKVSKTAAKLGDLNSYHHCTLLVDVNKDDFYDVLRKNEVNVITSAATKSFESKIINLSDENPKITVNGLLEAVGWEFLRTSPFSLRDGGMQLANKQKGFQMINPTNKWFPGINQLREGFEDWNWCYGKTPKFSISRTFTIPSKFLNINNPYSDELKITMTVEQGMIEDVSLYIPPGHSATGLSGDINVITNLKGHKFTEDALRFLEWSLSGKDNVTADDRDRFVTDCVRQVMNSV